MSLLETILIGGTVAFALYAVGTTALLAHAILQHRDKVYRERYERFLQTRSRVLDELDRQRAAHGSPRKKGTDSKG